MEGVYGISFLQPVEFHKKSNRALITETNYGIHYPVSWKMTLPRHEDTPYIGCASMDAAYTRLGSMRRYVLQKEYACITFGWVDRGQFHYLTLPASDAAQKTC